MKWLGVVLALAVLFGATAYQQAQVIPTPEQLGPVSPAKLPPIEVHFSPNGGCIEAVVAEVDAARTSILVEGISLTPTTSRQGLDEGTDGTITLVQAYSVASTPIVKSLVEARKRGVKVEVVFDMSTRSGNFSPADRSQDGGAKAPVDTKHNAARRNIMVVDGQVVITGGFDFAKAAAENSAGDLLVIRDGAIADRYTSHLKKLSQPTDTQETKVAETPEDVGPVTPPHAEPTTPLDESAKKFFASVAGKWHLSYQKPDGSRSEELSIDNSGNYFVTNRGAAPFYLLRDVFYDPTERLLIFSKVYAQGPRKGEYRQVEVLTLAPDGNSMKGHVQRDGHSVEYTKVNN